MENTMSTRACYRFIDTESAEVVTVYKHSDGYLEGAVCWITKALEHAWPLPRFEVDEFAAAFVAANRPSAKTRKGDAGLCDKLGHVLIWMAAWRGWGSRCGEAG
jgi:hypothetical protein